MVQQSEEPSFHVGDAVEGRYLDGSWYRAHIQKAVGDDLYFVNWDDGRNDDREKASLHIRHIGEDKASYRFQDELLPPPSSSSAAIEEHRDEREQAEAGEASPEEMVDGDLPDQDEEHRDDNEQTGERQEEQERNEEEDKDDSDQHE